MSFFPGEKLRYAETHFKFRLPWSLLYRPWPEILADAPFQFVPGEEPTLWIVVRDAHRFPTLIEKMEIQMAGAESKTIDLQIRATEELRNEAARIDKHVGLFTGNGIHQFNGPVVRFGQHPVVEQDHQNRKERCD